MRGTIGILEKERLGSHLSTLLADDMLGIQDGQLSRDQSAELDAESERNHRAVIFIILFPL